MPRNSKLLQKLHDEKLSTCYKQITQLKPIRSANKAIFAEITYDMVTAYYRVCAFNSESLPMYHAKYTYKKCMETYKQYVKAVTYLMSNVKGKTLKDSLEFAVDSYCRGLIRYILAAQDVTEVIKEVVKWSLHTNLKYQIEPVHMKQLNADILSIISLMEK